MNIAQSNDRFHSVMGGNKHTKHAMGINKNWWRERLKLQFGFDIWKLPVCNGCEGYGLWHRQGDEAVGYCHSCGKITHNPMTVEQYYEQGHHIDRTVHSDAPVVIERQIVLPGQTATVYGGEAGLQDQHKKIVIARC